MKTANVAMIVNVAKTANANALIVKKKKQKKKNRQKSVVAVVKNNNQTKNSGFFNPEFFVTTSRIFLEVFWSAL